MMSKQWFIAVSTVLAFAAGAQEAPPAPPVEKKPVEQTSPPPAAADSKPATATSKTDTAGKAGKTTAKDRIDLDSTSITGNRELPKVMYVVPWKKSGMGDLPGRPTNSLLDEVLAPVDREVFRRQTDYFNALDAHGKTEPNTTPSSSSQSSTGTEK